MTVKTDVRKGKYANGYTPLYTVYDVCSGGVVSSTSQSPTFVVYNALNKSRDCHDVPGWRTLIRNHANATGPYSVSGTATKIADQFGSISMRSKCLRTLQYGRLADATFRGTTVGPPTLVIPDFSSLRARAQNSCYSALLNEADASRSQMLVTLGEMHETMRMLRDPLVAAGDLVLRYYGSLSEKGARRLRKFFPRRFRDFASRRYLEFTYGWKPLNSDMNKLLASIKQLQLDPTYIDIQGFGKAADSSRTSEIPTSFASTASPYTPRLLYNDHVTNTCTCFAKAQIKCVSATSAPLDAALYYTGLTLPDVLPAAWELIPYSFLVDYFTNIGDVIRGSCVGFGDVTWGLTSRKDHASITRNFRYDEAATRKAYGDSLVSAFFYSDPHVLEYFSFTRGTGLPVPTLQVEIPGVDYFGLKKYLNMLALAHQKVMRS